MRKTRPGLTLLLVCLVIFALAPAAVAQLPADPIGGIGDPLGGDTGGSGGGSDGGSGSGGGLGDVVGGIGDTIGGEEGNSEPDGTNDDPQLIDELTKEVDETVNNPQEKIDETTQDPAGTVGGTIGHTADAATNDVNDISKGLTSPKGKGGKEKSTSRNHVTSGSRQRAAATTRNYDKVFAESLAARQADAKNRTPSTLTSSTTSAEDASTGVIQSIGRVAVEAVEQAAFPLLLTLLVGAFLIGQNRIDSRDPKLALAPLDSEQDLLSFS